MIKRFLVAFILVLILAGAAGLYAAVKYKQAEARPKLPAKAPEQSITLIEGWSNQQIGDYLEKNGIASSTTFLAAQKNFDTSDYPLLASRPAGVDLEGFIFPDTYFIPMVAPSGTDLSTIIIEKALNNFSVKITPDIISGAKAQGLNLFQLITLASIIEKEANGDMTEKQTVAGIFYNRLKAGMPLQSDATVAYAVGHSDISDADTQVNSPYNTYLYPGLPVGPICNPSLASIEAAANPIASNYLYFLTIPGTGQAVYAQTYQEHLANKQKYLK